MLIETISRQISGIVEQFGTSSQSREELANLLRQLAYEKDFWMEKFRPADQNEELLYEVAIDKNSGVALYLVSDSTEIKSPPHSHHTWAIIAGINGTELNRFYTITDHEKRTVKEVKSMSIGAGDVIHLLEDDIHSTEVVGLQSTYHLHLYGCDLKALPAFSERIFIATT